MTLTELLEHLATGFEALGAAALELGMVLAVGLAGWAPARPHGLHHAACDLRRRAAHADHLVCTGARGIVVSGRGG